MADGYGDVQRMRKIPTEYVVPGMVVARDVMTRNNQIVIPKDAVVTERALEKLKALYIPTVYVCVDETLQKINTGYSEQIRNSREYKDFSRRFDKSVVVVRDSLIQITKTDGAIDTDKIVNDVEGVVGRIDNNIGTFQMINSFKTLDDDTFIHSMNVAMICNVFANWLGLSERDKRTLMMGGIFHDIGKLLVPKVLLRKPSKLSDVEYEMIKLHTVKGYEFLNGRKVPPKVMRMALNHHERYDGSGYPNHKKGEELDDFSTILAIADVFEAMTSKRVYRDSLCPFEVIRFLEGEGYHFFNPKIIIPLLEKMTEAYIGHTVRLSDNQEGEIIQINRYLLSRPIIRVSDGTFLDLSTDRAIEIIDVL